MIRSSRREWLRQLAGTAVLVPAVHVAASSGSAEAAPASANEPLVVDLRAWSGVPGQIVETSGYAAPADGGGGTFVWTGEPRPDDGGVVIAASGGSWVRTGADPLTLRHFGARGDGSTDDTAAIQRAVDTAAALGLPLHVPPGTFLLQVSGNQPISFHKTGPRAYCIRLPSGLRMSGPGLFRVAGDIAETGTAFLASNARDISLAGFHIRGEIDGTLKDWLHSHGAVSLDACVDCEVDGLTIQAMRGGVVAFNSARIAIRNCRSSFEPSGEIRRSSHFALFTSIYSEIRSCRSFGRTSDGDVGVFGYPGYQNRICDNEVYAAPEGDYIPASGSAKGQGIFIDSGQSDITVDGNLISGFFYGVDVKTFVSDVVIRQNRIEKCFIGIAVRLGEGKGETARITCADNSIAMNGGGNDNLKPNFMGGVRAIGIYTQAAIRDSLVVSGNQIGDSRFFFDAAEGSGAGANYKIQNATAFDWSKRLPETSDFGPVASVIRIKQSETNWVGIWIDCMKDQRCHYQIASNRIGMSIAFGDAAHRSSGIALRVRGSAAASFAIAGNWFSGSAVSQSLIDVKGAASVRMDGNALNATSRSPASWSRRSRVCRRSETSSTFRRLPCRSKLCSRPVFQATTSPRSAQRPFSSAPAPTVSPCRIIAFRSGSRDPRSSSQKAVRSPARTMSPSFRKAPNSPFRPNSTNATAMSLSVPPDMLNTGPAPAANRGPDRHKQAPPR